MLTVPNWILWVFIIVLIVVVALLVLVIYLTVEKSRRMESELKDARDELSRIKNPFLRYAPKKQIIKVTASGIKFNNKSLNKNNEMALVTYISNNDNDNNKSNNNTNINISSNISGNNNNDGKAGLATPGYIDCSLTDENKSNNNNKNNNNSGGSECEDMYDVIETKNGDGNGDDYVNNSLPIQNPQLHNVVTSVQMEGFEKKNNNNMVISLELPNIEPQLINQVSTMAIEGAASKKFASYNNNDDGTAIDSLTDENKSNNNYKNNDKKNNDISSSDCQDIYDAIAETKSGDGDDPNLNNFVKSLELEGLGLEKQNNVKPQLKHQVSTLAIQGVASKKLANNNNNNNNIIYSYTNVIELDWIKLWSIDETYEFLSFMMKSMNNRSNIHDNNEMNTILVTIKMMELDGKKLNSAFELPKDLQRQTIEDHLYRLKTPFKDQLITEILKLNWFDIIE